MENVKSDASDLLIAHKVEVDRINRLLFASERSLWEPFYDALNSTEIQKLKDSTDTDHAPLVPKGSGQEEAAIGAARRDIRRNGGFASTVRGSDAIGPQENYNSRMRD